MDMKAYRNRELERQRITDLRRLIPPGGALLDVGARDGYMSVGLLDQFESVTALDLKLPAIADERITCVEGDITDLRFPSNTFDVVLCAEVLEHIPPEKLPRACKELLRVARTHVVIGVPFRQDIRYGRTTCASCGARNPPWGHVNTFHEARLKELFPGHPVEVITFVGDNHERTNGFSATLMNWAGNPYGTYIQEEACIFCGGKIGRPRTMRLMEKGCAKLAIWANRMCRPLYDSHPNWIHIRFAKKGG